MKHFWKHSAGRILGLTALYGLILGLSLFLAYQLRFDFAIPRHWSSRLWQDLAWLLPLQWALLYAFGQFRGILSYFRFPDLYRLFLALAIASGLAVILWYASGGSLAPPRSVILGNLLFSFTLLAGLRSLLRLRRERRRGGERPLRKALKRTLIIGAGDAGAQITADLLAHPSHGYLPVVLLDDDSRKVGRDLHGVPIQAPVEALPSTVEALEIEEIIIAVPSATPKQLQAWMELAKQSGYEPKTIPSLEQLADGTVTALQIRPIQIEDLLGRKPVQLDTGPIKAFLKDQTVLVTGAGGSIGSELCQQILQYQPTRLVLVEQSEGALFEICRELRADEHPERIAAYLGSVADSARMRAILEREHPTVLFHAAAHKHVPILESQPAEALKNNLRGTKVIADLASAYQVAHFILISTDKAVNPTSVMGASKRLAELYLQQKQLQADNQTRFSAVRFGNVLGSSGSVVPLFRKQIQSGGPVTVTDPDVTRYFMTLQEAVGLILQAATQGEGGEIFVLDMGEPIKIVDLARQMIELSGYRPEIDIEIQFTGLRPGEKAFEELRHGTENHATTRHPKIYCLTRKDVASTPVEAWLKEMETSLKNLPPDALKQRIQAIIPEYTPYLESQIKRR